MRARLAQWLDLLRTGFWFIPSVMLGLSATLALVLLRVDEHVDPGMKASIGWAYTGGPEGARSLLSTVAGSMITAASVTFSLASVALSIASQQYGSRVLRNFMRDRITQVLLGTFVSTFVYSVLVVRDIRGSDFSGGFVPAIAITVAIVLSLISLVMLVYFVHHVSSSIQASHIVSTISGDMQTAIPKLYPSKVCQGAAGQHQSPEARSGEASTIEIMANGYLQTIDLQKLLEVAETSDLFLELTQKPGDHIVSGATVATAWGATALDEKIVKRLQNAFLIGPERTPAQDIRYQFQQLTDVVVRALSPGINDPFTAINGMDELASGLALLARHPRIPEERQDEKGVLRLLVPRPQICDILQDTVGHIAVYGAGDPFVMARLRTVLDIVAPDLRGHKELDKLRSLRQELDRREQAKRDT